MAKNGNKIYFFSAEMSKTELYVKILSRLTDIDNKRISQKTLSSYEIERIEESKKNLHIPLFINDRTSIDTDYIKQGILNFRRRNKGIDCVFIDHLHLLKDRHNAKTRNDLLGNITSDLKAIAKELNIPIICLSQLSRNTEMQGADKVPKLSDLRESGNIEQNADLVILLFRESYYLQEKIRNSKKAFLRHREQRCVGSYEVKLNIKTKANKPTDPIADIADTTLPYLSYLNRYGDRNIKVIEEWFCSNRTLKNLKEKYTERKKEIKTITKTKKSGKLKTKEIEVIREYFHEMELYDDLCEMVEVLDGIMVIQGREEERRELWSETEKIEMEKKDDGYEGVIKKLENVVKKEGKIKTATMLKIDIKTLHKILKGSKKYSFKYTRG
jgi:hypothetical protein